MVQYCSNTSNINFCIDVVSGQWRHSGPGQPGWDPETPSAFPPRGPPAAVPHLSGEWTSSSWTAGPTTVVPEGKG